MSVAVRKVSVWQCRQRGGVCVCGSVGYLCSSVGCLCGSVVVSLW